MRSSNLDILVSHALFTSCLELVQTDLKTNTVAMTQSSAANACKNHPFTGTLVAQINVSF